MLKLTHINITLGASLLLTACTIDDASTTTETPSKDNPVAVSFKAYTARNTRAGIKSITNANELAEVGGFGVFAYEQGNLDYATYSTIKTYPNFFYNQQVKGYDNSDALITDATTQTVDHWSYEPTKYYSNNTGAKHSFFAYAPYQADMTPAFIIGSAPTVKYNIKQDIDLLWSEPYINKEKPGVTETLTFNFKHALSKLTFKVAPFIDKVHSDGAHGNAIAPTSDPTSMPAGTSVSVRSIRLSGVVPTEGKLNLGNGNWIADTSAEYLFLADASTASWKGTPTEVIKYKDLSPIKIIPSSGLKIEVTYDVTSDDNGSGKPVTTTNTVKSMETFAFEQGKAYNLTLDLGLTTVKFDATVVDWTDGGTHIIDLPNNVPWKLFRTMGGAPTVITTLHKQETEPATSTAGDYWFNPITRVLKEYKTVAPATEPTYVNVTANGIYQFTDSETPSNTWLYFVGSDPTFHCTVYNANEYTYKVDGVYKKWNGSVWDDAEMATSPNIYSFTITDEGKIQTGADPDANASWTTPENGKHYIYTLGDVDYLYQWIKPQP